ncbi:MAG: PEP-CTERM sorting domain-containing protein [Chthonomonadales bacterium]
MKCRFAANASRVIALATLGLALAIPSQAQTMALDFTGGITGSADGNNTLGWEFALSSSVTVKDLGIYDEGDDGLVNSHQVGLWTTGGTLLASTTLASGLSGTDVSSISTFGSFRFNSITDLVLGPGSYVLGAAYLQSDADVVRTNTSAPSMAPGFSFTQGHYNLGSGFAFPGGTFATSGGHFGPNLRISSSDVPEPGMVVSLLGAGSLGGFMLIRRRQSRRSLK